MSSQHESVPSSRPRLLDGKPDLPTFVVRLMEAKNWDQTELAEALDVNQGTVSKWVRAESEPRRVNRPRLAEVAGIDIDELGAVIARTEFVTRRTRSQLERENAELRRELGRE